MNSEVLRNIFYTTLPKKNLLHGYAIFSSDNLAMAGDTDRTMRKVLKDSEEKVIRRLLKDCTKTSIHPTSGDITIKLNCYVFSEQELETLLLDTREQAQREAERWMWNRPGGSSQ